MHRRKYSPLIALPLIAIAFIAFGMTRSAFAASSAPSQSSSQPLSVQRLLQRVANRTNARRRALRPPRNLRPAAAASASSSSRRSASRSSSAVATQSAEEVGAEVMRLVNIEREKEGLSALTYNKTLEKSAQQYAERLHAERCFSHTECGSTLKERMHESGYYQGGNYSYYYGENIARGQDSAAEAVEDWMNSPPHREAILSTTFTEIGVGKSGNYWVQHFGAVK